MVKPDHIGAAERDDALSSETAVEVQGIEHAYGEHVALRGVSFKVDRGEFFGLLGPNGGGKTTLFRILSTLLVPDRGTARILDLDLVRDRAEVRRRLGVVFQSAALDPKLTVRENLKHQGHLYGLRGRVLHDRIDSSLGRFNLTERRDQRVEVLSGGLRRRVELVKGLLHRPRVLVLDEPSSGLDPGARRDLWDLLQEIREAEGVTVLLTSHILEEAERCDRVGILDRGSLVVTGTPRELKAQVGGNVLSVTTREPEKIAHAITSRFEVEAVILENTVRLEQPEARGLVRELMDAFPDEIESVTLSKPTLEDVFIHCTGHAFNRRSGEGEES